MTAASPFFPRLRTLSAVCLAAATLGFAGCANFAGIHSDKQIASADSFATQRSLPNEGGQWPGTDWADHFGDPQLTQLIGEALASNPDLAVAQARLNAARAQVEGAGAALLPSVNLAGSVYREKFTQNTIYPPGFGGVWFTQGDVMASLDWELDLWGKNRAARSQATSQEKSVEAEDQEVHLTLSTAVARAYNQLAQQYALRDVIERQIQQRESLGKLTLDRVRAGLDTQVEQKQAESNTADANTQLAQIDGQILLTRHQLGALLGKGPDRGLDIARPSLNAQAALQLPDNVPLSLLGRRPDIVSARWAVESQLKGVDVAKARFYPDVNLNAAFGFSTFGLGKLFSASSQNIQYGPAISLPIFDGGRLRANLKGQYAAYEAAVANYDATLNKALTDIADRVSSIRANDKQLVSQRVAQDAAQHAYDLAVQRYRAGLVPQLLVLNTESALLTQETTRVNLEGARRDQQIGLIKALGGGFDANAAGLSPDADKRTSASTDTAPSAQ
ncbi:efflux transporter outer membrane subunit [Pandoraea terrae]|nr:efflux transporter outer membrane subunit [Pandoraea terrae]